MTETTKTFDAVIIGAGPGGYVAAIRAAQLGLKVALVEEKHLGGVCLNWGCIPTKALLRTSELYHTISHADEFGINVGDSSFDFEKVIARSRAVSKQLAQGVQHLLKKNKVTVINGRAQVAGKTADGLHNVEVSVEGKVESGWILVDCGEVVINIMKSDIRDFYDLEGLWGGNTLLNNSN